MAYIGRGTDKISNIEVLDNITFTNSAGPYNLLKDTVAFVPTSSNALVISIDGIVQSPSSYTLSAATITFDSSMASTSTMNFIYQIGAGVITTPSDDSVTTAKIAALSVTTPKIANNNVTYGKMQSLVTGNRVLGRATAGEVQEVQVSNDMLAGSIDVTTKITGTVPTANLGSGTASSSTYLAGDQSYKTITEFNDDAIINDISTLALHQATNNNSAKYNLVNTNVDVYQDSSAITNLTNVNRNTTGEYISSVSETQTAFTTSTTWSRGSVTEVNLLVVAGGGGGGYDCGAGGGAGGLVHIPAYTVGASTYTVTVGAGGAGSGAGSSAGTSGGNSVFGSVTAVGGGGGGSATAAPTTGGSGGGAPKTGAASTGAASTQTTTNDGYAGTGYGFAGGDAASAGSTAAGGGGAGSVGGNAVQSGTYKAGDGGLGKDLSATFGTSVGDSGWFSGGAGGSNEQASGERGFGNGSVSGKGGGGDGGATLGSHVPQSGTANTGGGGGGYLAGAVGAGGSGAVIIKYDTTSATGSYESTAQTANASVSKISGVVTYTNTTGTATLNTDIVLQVSADNGSTWQNATLTAGGTFSTGVLQAVTNDVTVVAGTQVKYKMAFANQALATKETRINGISLAY